MARGVDLIRMPLVLLLFTPAPTAAQSAIPLDEAGSYFAEAVRIGEAGRTLWGLGLGGALIFVDRPTRAIVANAPDSAGLLVKAADGIWTGMLPEGVAVANTASTWGGRTWTMLVWPLPTGRVSRARLIGHEQFHALQARLGLPMNDPANAHLETRDGRYWMRLEWRALVQALANDDGAARRQALADARGFRLARRLLAPGAAAEENALELNEGLAEYTGFHATGMAAALLRGRAIGQLESHDAQAASASIVRNFAYATGPAYGLLLDDAGADWRRGLSSASDLAEMAARAYAVDTVGTRAGAAHDPVAAAGARSGTYGGAWLARAEDAREAERIARQADFRARFQDGPLLALPVASAFQFSFDPNDAAVMKGIGTVYGAAELRDEWGQLKVTSGGVLLLRGEAGYTGVVVTAPAQAAAAGETALRVDTAAPADRRSLSGDGWTLQLAEGWELRPGARPGDWRVVPSGA